MEADHVIDRALPSISASQRSKCVISRVLPNDRNPPILAFTHRQSPPLVLEKRHAIRPDVPDEGSSAGLAHVTGRSRELAHVAHGERHGGELAVRL
jgi:hypothetical protein